jgi:hypothetical protein
VYPRAPRSPEECHNNNNKVYNKKETISRKNIEIFRKISFNYCIPIYKSKFNFTGSLELELLQSFSNKKKGYHF